MSRSIQHWQKQLLVLAAGLAVGCGGSSTGTTSGGSPSSGGSGGGHALDCAWLSGSNNCYRSTLAAAETCLPAEATQGVIASSGGSCAYDGGETVTFIPPLGASAPATWQFTVNMPDGGLCLSYQGIANNGGFRIQTAAGTVSEQLGNSLTIQCPDGTSATTSDTIALLSCDGGLLLPGDVSSDDGVDSATFGLLNGPGGNTVSVFACLGQ